MDQSLALLYRKEVKMDAVVNYAMNPKDSI